MPISKSSPAQSLESQSRGSTATRYFKVFKTKRQSSCYVGFISACIALMGYALSSLYHSALPYLIKELHNQTTTSTTNLVLCGNSTLIQDCIIQDEAHLIFKEDNDRVSEDIGIVIGFGAVGQVVASFSSILLLVRFSLRFNLLVALLFIFTSCILLLLKISVIMLCIANCALSFGVVLTYVAVVALQNEFAKDQKEMTRMAGLYRLAVSLGFTLGYFVIIPSLQFIGRLRTMLGVICFLALELVFRFTIPAKKIDLPEIKIADTIEEELGLHNESGDDVMIRQANTKKALADDTKIVDGLLSKWWNYLRNPYTILHSIHCLGLLVNVWIFYGTGGNYVATVLKAEQWQTGVIMGVGQCLDVVCVVLVICFITTTRRRWVTLVISYLLFAVGCFWYPFTRSVWEAIAPEVLIRSSRATALIQQVTLLRHICECEEIGDNRIPFTVMTCSYTLGVIMGSYSCGVLVVLMTFKWLYFFMGSSAVIAAMSAIAFSRLKPKLSTSNKAEANFISQ